MFIYSDTSIGFEKDTRMEPIFKLDDSTKTRFRRKLHIRKPNNKNVFSRDVLKMNGGQFWKLNVFLKRNKTFNIL